MDGYVRSQVFLNPTSEISQLLLIVVHCRQNQIDNFQPLAQSDDSLDSLQHRLQPPATVLGVKILRETFQINLDCIQVLAQLNASVRVVGKHPGKLARCEKWGIKHRLLAELSPRADQDVVVDCTGSADGLATAMQMVRPRGKIVLKTTVADSPGLDLSPLVINEIDLIGSRCGPFPEALALLSEGAVDVINLISRRAKLADGPTAFAAAQSDDVIKVLLEFD